MRIALVWVRCTPSNAAQSAVPCSTTSSRHLLHGPLQPNRDHQRALANMLQASLHSKLIPSAVAAASRVLPFVLPSLCKLPAQQQVSQYPHTSCLLQGVQPAPHINTISSFENRSLWHGSSSTSNSRVRATMPSLAHSRCFTTSAAAAAAAADLAKQVRVPQLAPLIRVSLSSCPKAWWQDQV
jgi:hypothetical protein